MSERLLRDVPSGTRFKHQVKSVHDVVRCEFLVFLGQSGEALPELDRLINTPEYIVTVIVGSAKVFYEIKAKRVENGFEKHIVTIQSAYSMEQGILGYTFLYAGQRFSTAFPGEIVRGKRKYPPFYTCPAANVLVEVVGGSNSEVSTETKKLSRFLF
jgi:hypothetical protein